MSMQESPLSSLFSPRACPMMEMAVPEPGSLTSGMSRKVVGLALSDRKLWASTNKGNKFFPKDSTKIRISIGKKLSKTVLKLSPLWIYVVTKST